MPELATFAAENVESPPRQTLTEELVMVRCPDCQGLRGISIRHARPEPSPCMDCRRGKVVPRWTFCTYWTDRFTMEEIMDMAKAIWG